jgi:uncharacterized phiE125 gp8 family phage protein
MYDTSLFLVTDKTVYPVTVAEVKQQLNIADDETAHDDYLSLLIKTCTQQWEYDTQTKTTRETWRYVMEAFPQSDEFYIPYGPIASISSIQYYDVGDDLQTLETVYYSLDGITGGIPKGNSRVWLNHPYDWPSTYTREDAVQVTFVAGYAATATAVPQIFRHAILLLCTFYFEHRGEPVVGQMPMYPAYEHLVRRFMRSSYP